FSNPINKKAASITALALIALAIPLTVFISQQQQEIRQRAQEVSPLGGGGIVSLVLAPSSSGISLGSTFEVVLNLNPGANIITGLDVIIRYDKNFLEIDKFNPTNTLGTQLINNVDNQAGTLRYAAVNTQSENPSALGGGDPTAINLGTITFKAKAEGTSNVTFDNIQITALGQTGSLPTANNVTGSYTVISPTTEPIPTLTGSPSAPLLINYNTSFSSTQGKNDIYYLAYGKSSNSYVSANWDGSKWAYTGEGSDRNFQISRGSMAPSYGANSVVRWVAPQEGKISISGYFQRCCTEAGDFNYSPRTIYSIRRNNEVLWTQDANDQTKYNYSLLTTIFSPGEKIEFWADANKDSGWDGTNFDFVISFMPSSSPTLPPGVTPTTAPQRVEGDANGDNSVDILDFNIWRDEFLGNSQTKQADFNGDGVVDLLDFAIWRNAIAAPNPSPTSPPQASAKRVFVTSTTYNGNLEGLAGADAKCQARAGYISSALGGGGSVWKAWLSDSNTSAASRLTHADSPYQLINGSTVSNNWADLTDGTLQNPINITEFNTIPNSMSGVWTNTNIFGEAYFSGNNNKTCKDYTSSVYSIEAYYIFGRNGSSDGNWTLWSSDNCSSNARLYCFEQ
ncbi:MAG: hypothetical protein HYZ02_00430, partial [Candidatus Levybacteria bacterium]|nr:hypothetical protein [Candidatus Levybacteria bacterium]